MSITSVNVDKFSNSFTRIVNGNYVSVIDRDLTRLTLMVIPGASIPMGQGGHAPPPIFMKGGHPW